MRFIDATSWSFREASDRELPRLRGGYSILSHRWTWGADEVLYTDILSMDEAVKTKGGFAKFAGSCALAKKLGYDLIWIDTCCINKSDSVELSEAINSMYRWYSMSTICIAYLEDVGTGSNKMEKSEWFARGWTLQELIASKKVSFYDSTWNYLGDKISLSSQLVRRTGIPEDVLKDFKPPQAYSIAQRMSWAANRTTTRLEDRAYSLMGLFDVNMAMIYGEREQAFVRLQEHIIARSADESIFLWDLGILEDSTRNAKQVRCGLLAPSPACFARCGDITDTGRTRGFTINQFGVTICSPARFHTLDIYRATLEVKNSQTAGRCAILLAQIQRGSYYARVSTSTGDSFVMTEKCDDQPMEFRIPLNPISQPMFLYHGFWLRKLDLHNDQIASYTTFRRREGGRDRLLLPTDQSGTAGIIRLNLRNNDLAWIKLGFNAACRPVCCLVFAGPDNALETVFMARQAKVLEEAHSKSPHLLKIGLGTPERVHHQFFNDDWIKSLKELSASTSGSYHDPRELRYAQSDAFNLVHQAKGFTITASAERVPDVSLTSSTNTKQEVWAVDIVAEETVPPSRNRSAFYCWLRKER